MSSDKEDKTTFAAAFSKSEMKSPSASIQRKRTSSSAKKRSNDGADENSKADTTPKQQTSSTPSASKKASSMSSSSSSSKKWKPSSNTDVNAAPAPASSVLESATAAPDTSAAKKTKRTFNEMIVEAIQALKDRTGSSQVAIQKYILSEWTDIEDNATFRSRMGQALKKGVAAKQFQKIKASYKLSSEWMKKERAKKAKHSAKKIAEKKQRDKAILSKRNESEAKRIETMRESMSPEDVEELRIKHEKKKKAQALKEEEERKAKERAERLRKRRFPIEDTKLHDEDKELGLAPPKTLKRRPILPYFFQIARADNKSHASSRCDAMDHECRGLVPDVLQVYHFFRGDVRFCDLGAKKMVADFTLTNLIYAVDEVLLGNSKKSKMIPPLLVHLFCVSLMLLCNPVSDGTETRAQAQLYKDLKELGQALNPVSWPEICVLYMDCMNRYYKGSSSQDHSVLKPGHTDVKYLFRVTDTPDLTQIAPDLPDGFNGYFGPYKSTLSKAVDKLGKQEPWMLQAEDIMALLRALTDDILATRPDLTVEMTAREEELAELAKAKRAADSNFRKVRLAFEGPPPSRAKPVTSQKKDGEEAKSASKDEEKKAPEKKEKEWKQTASKRQFDQAKKDQQQANDAYEGGLKKLIARTEPFGMDRHFNRYYCFLNDSEFIFCETIRPVSGPTDELPEELQVNRTSWHAIDKVSLLEQFAASLDVRGHREKNLYEALMGPEDASNTGFRRFVYDDVKEKAQLAARKDQRDALQKEFEDLRLRHLRLEEEGLRRPSRSQTDPVAALEQKIETLDRKIAKDETPFEPDYVRLTGIEAVRKFDSLCKRSTRRDDPDLLGLMPVTNLIPGGKGSGLVGWHVHEMLVVEQLCQSLVPWQQEDERRKWIVDLESLSQGWNESSQLVLGPEIEESDVVDNDTVGNGGLGISSVTQDRRHSIGSSDGKRRRVDSPPTTQQASLNHIVSQLKEPLLVLEERIYEVSGLAMADRDQNIADDNMSAGDAEENTEEDKERERLTLQVAWKKKVHLIRNIPAKKPSLIRETLVQAIALARKAHLGSIVSKLRAALLLYHSDAAGHCKQAAVAVLDEHGGYSPDEDEDDEDDEDEQEVTPTTIATNTVEVGKHDSMHIPSNLCFEAMSLLGSLNDDDQATRSEWREAVQQCKTISRLAALSTAFCSKATELLEKFLSERKSLEKALDKWQKEEERKKRSTGTKKSNRQVAEQPTEMWADVEFTHDFCMVRLAGHPWWPAKKCIAKDEALQVSLQSFDRVLVSMVGEHGELRCVKMEDIQEFTGKPLDENIAEFSLKDTSQLEDCLAIARRILRGRTKMADRDQDYVEEKKTGF